MTIVSTPRLLVFKKSSNPPRLFGTMYIYNEQMILALIRLDISFENRKDFSFVIVKTLKAKRD